MKNVIRIEKSKGKLLIDLENFGILLCAEEQKNSTAKKTHASWNQEGKCHRGFSVSIPRQCVTEGFQCLYTNIGSVPTKDMQPAPPLPLRNGQIFMKDTECAEKKYIFFAIFIFRVILKIPWKLTIFGTKMSNNDHNSKNLKFDFSFYSADSESFM